MREWDALVGDLETLTAEMRAKVDGDTTPPVVPPEGEVIYVEENLPQAIKDAPAGAVLDLGGLTFLATIVIDKPLTVQNGEICAPGPNVNDLVTLKHGTSGVTLRDLILRGEGSTKRGISNQAAGTVLERVEVRNICREGQETQAMAMWDSPGPLTATDCYFEGGALTFLAGGSTPTIPNTIATGLTFTRCTFTRPLEWRDKAYACKNSFELKCARDVLVEDCEISNVWAQGQAGYAIQLTPSQYGGSPETTVENVTFRRCHIHDAGNGVNCLGYSQHSEPERVTQRGGHYRFEDCTFENILLSYEGQGAAVTCAHSPHDVALINCSVHEDGAAFLRVSDKEPVEALEWRGGRITVAGTYGVFAPQGSRGVKWEEIAPGGIIAGVTLVGAHSTFKANFPDNTYESAEMNGRKPVPTALKVLRGNPGRRPLNADEPQPPPLTADPVPPELKDAHARAEWSRLAPALIACGQVTAADKELLTGYCLKVGQWRRLEEHVLRHPLATDFEAAVKVIRIANQTRELVNRMAAELGLTPSSRTRVTRTPAPTASKWAGVLP